VVLQLAAAPRGTFRELAASVGLSLGEAHNSVKRLEMAHLASPASGSINVQGTLEFVLHGVPYAFPAQVGPERRGIPTAFKASPIADQIESPEAFVWPSTSGRARGASLVPLCPSPGDVWERNQPLYELLVLVDAIRVGRARERDMARKYLRTSLLSLLHRRSSTTRPKKSCGT